MVAACLGLAVASACAGKSIQNGDDQGGCDSCGASGGSSGQGGSSARGGVGARGGTAGSGGSAGITPGDAGITPCEGQADGLRLRRLTASDIHRTLDHALGEGPTIQSSWPEHRLGPRGVVTEAEARALVTMARERARAYAATDFGCDLDDEACSTREINRVARRLRRRPSTSSEELELATLYERSEGTARSRFAAVVEALIESPHFVFRVELGNGVGPADQATPLTSYEVATRLAYFLWRSGPDDALLEAADANLLATAEGVELQASRMFVDSRTLYGLTELTREWLELVNFDANADAVGLSEELRADMREQTELFLQRIFGRAPTLDELLLASLHPINPALAEHYDAGTFRLIGFAEYPLDPDRFSGILTYGTLLVSTPTLSRRGSLVRRRLLCDTITPPASKPVPEPEDATRRAAYEEIGTQPACAGCHALLDPVGYGLAGFDQQGRALDQAVDGYLIYLESGLEQPFVGPRDLAALLVSNPAVSACTARHWLEYALDRGPGEPVLMIPPSGGDDPPVGPGGGAPLPTGALECVSNDFFGSGRSFVTLVRAIAASDPFRTVTGALPLTSLPSAGSSATPIDHAIAETASLRAAYEADAPLLELDAYLTALRAVAGDDPGTGGAGGAGP